MRSSQNQQTYKRASCNLPNELAKIAVGLHLASYSCLRLAMHSCRSGKLEILVQHFINEMIGEVGGRITFIRKINETDRFTADLFIYKNESQVL